MQVYNLPLQIPYAPPLGNNQVLRSEPRVELVGYEDTDLPFDANSAEILHGRDKASGPDSDWQSIDRRIPRVNRNFLWPLQGLPSVYRPDIPCAEGTLRPGPSKRKRQEDETVVTEYKLVWRPSLSHPRPHGKAKASGDEPLCHWVKVQMRERDFPPSVVAQILATVIDQTTWEEEMWRPKCPKLKDQQAGKRAYSEKWLLLRLLHVTKKYRLVNRNWNRNCKYVRSMCLNPVGSYSA